MSGRWRRAARASGDPSPAQRAEGVVADLGLSGKSFEQMHARMEAWLGRRIEIRHHRMDSSLACGIWLGWKHQAADTIYVDRTSPSWQHVVAHEWGHMLCGHGEVGTTRLLDEVDWVVPASAVRFALGRSLFDEAHEADAERVADVIDLLRVDHARRMRHLGTSGGFQGVL